MAYIRKLMDDYFYIEVAAYSEFHPESENVMDALKNFQKKLQLELMGQLFNISILVMPIFIL